MGEPLRVVLPIVAMLGGLALIAYTAYLHYVALPEEQTRKHRLLRGAMAAGGVILVLLASRFLS